MKPSRRQRPSWLLAPVALLAACWQTTTVPPAPPPSSGAVTPKPTPKPTPVAPSDPIVALASQSFHTCALRKSGTALCWGKNGDGQLGNGTRVDSSRVVKVEGLQDAVELAVGSNFSCARRKAGDVVCWGNNEFGQLGDGRGAKPGAIGLRPVQVAGLRKAVQISSGEQHACALEQGGTVQCWGDGFNGQIGSDAQRMFAKPLPIEQLRPVSRIASGAAHVCALETAGVVKCWGRNTEGQLGDGKSGSRIKPVQVANLEDAVELVSGHRHTCARQRSGRTWCWGDNSSTQLGANAGQERKRGTPVELAGLTDAVELAGGSDHACARQRSGRVVCWGSNAAGQLGQRSTVTRLAKPTPVRGVSDAVALALGATHGCAVRKTGDIACWGDSRSGALGPYTLI